MSENQDGKYADLLTGPAIETTVCNHTERSHEKDNGSPAISRWQDFDAVNSRFEHAQKWLSNEKPGISWLNYNRFYCHIQMAGLNQESHILAIIIC